MPKLELRREAANAAAFDLALTGQTIGGVRTPRVGPQRLPPVATVVEHDRMDVDLAPRLFTEHQPRRKAWFGGRVVRVTERRQRLTSSRAIRLRDDDVEVAVRAGLGADEGIDP